MTSSNAKAEKKKYILLNNSGSKNSLSMKLGKFMSLKEKNIKFFCKNCDLKTSFSSFCVCNELSTTSIGK